jgi:hypothetical protein
VHIPVPLNVLQGDLKKLTIHAETENVDPDGTVREGRTVFHIIDRDHWKVDQTDGTTVVAKRKK